jgi:hypothetical protein
MAIKKTANRSTKSVAAKEHIWIKHRILMKEKSIRTTIAPWLTVLNGEEAVSFYKIAFDVETYRLETPWIDCETFCEWSRILGKWRFRRCF